MIDKNYRKLPLLDWERKSISKRFSFSPPSGESIWTTLGLTTLMIVAISLIAPFLPSRHPHFSWSPPTNFSSYITQVTASSIIISTIYFGSLIFGHIRNSIDLRLNTKLVANFEVLEVFDCPGIKLVIMTGFRPFAIRAKSAYFRSITEGQIITIKRTGTFRLVDYYIRDEKRFQYELSKANADDNLH